MQTNSTGDVTTCTFMGNTALNGGAIYQNMASGSILRTALTNNVAGQKGGAVFGETSTGNIMNSTFTLNRASQAGGAGKGGHRAGTHVISLFSLSSCRWCCPSVVKSILSDRHPYYLLLHAVFLNNCASSMSFSIFTQNDAGQGSGGAVYRCASLLTTAEADHHCITRAAHIWSDRKLKPCALQECLQGLHYKLQLH